MTAVHLQEPMAGVGQLKKVNCSVGAQCVADAA
jgi:hypothetical protein